MTSEPSVDNLAVFQGMGGEYRFEGETYSRRIDHVSLTREAGKVTRSQGLVYEAYLPGAAVGSVCRILTGQGKVLASEGNKEGIDAEVIGFHDRRVVLMPFDEAKGVNNESYVVLRQKSSTVKVGQFLLGRVLDARGEPVDGKPPIDEVALGYAYKRRELYRPPVEPLKRTLIAQGLDLGVRAFNGLLTCGKGQRVGIMAGSGVGKSVLLGMMARNTKADVNVIALIGERGREVREFIERDLGPEGLKRSVIIVATSEKSPLLRVRAAYLATTIAEHFRDQGKDVLFLMDSITRFCMAQREIGLSVGEPPTSRGYTPSVFSTLPKILERVGTSAGRGSITGLYTVLVESDDMDDPIADATRSILDGHVVLSRKIAQKNHFPAIDVLQSTSRVMPAVVSAQHLDWASRIREWMALYAQAEDLINIGAYARGASPKIDQAIAVHDRIDSLLRQKVDEKTDMASTLAEMQSIVRAAEAHAAGPASGAGGQQQAQAGNRAQAGGVRF